MTLPLRVVHVVEELRRGGLEKVVRDIVTSLDRSRFDPAVWCLARGGDIADEVAAARVGVRVFDMGQRPSARFLLELAGCLRRAGAAIVHCHGYTACTAGRLAAVLARTPRIFAHVHTQEHFLTPRQRLLARGLAAVTTKVVCISESVRDFVMRWERVPRARTEVIYNGVADPRLPDPGEARRRWGIPDAAKVVGCVASLVSHKGHAILIEAARAARVELPELSLLIVGGGPLQGELTPRARAAGISALFTGPLTDVAPALAAMDLVALLPDEREGLSLALIEALAASKPVIGSRVGGIPEVIQEGVNGLLCEPGDPAGAAAGIVRILGDPERARVMGEAGRRIYLGRFTRERMVSEIERLYGS